MSLLNRMKFIKSTSNSISNFWKITKINYSITIASSTIEGTFDYGNFRYVDDFHLLLCTPMCVKPMEKNWNF